MRLERPRLEFGVELNADEPRMVLVFDDLRQHAVRRHAGEAQAVLLEAVLVGGVDLVAVAVAPALRYRTRVSRQRARTGGRPASPA